MTTAQLIQETYIHYDKNGEKTTRYRKGYPKQHENKKVKKAFLKNYQKIQFHDPDEQTHRDNHIQLMRKYEKLYPGNQEPFTHPNDANLQIYPTKTNEGIEHLYIDLYGKEPETQAQKRAEELKLGIF